MSQEPVSPDPVKEPAAIAASNTTTAQGPVAGQTGQAAPATAAAQATAQEPGVSDPFDEEAWIQQLRKEKQSAPAEVKPAEPADQPNYVERKDYEKWLYKMGQDMSELKRGNDALTQLVVQSQQNREQNAAPSELDFTTPMTADLRPLQQRTSNTERVAQDALRRATAAQDEAEWTGITMREPEARQYETLVRLVVASNPQIRVGDAYAEVKKAAGGNRASSQELQKAREEGARWQLAKLKTMADAANRATNLSPATSSSVPVSMRPQGGGGGVKTIREAIQAELGGRKLGDLPVS